MKYSSNKIILTVVILGLFTGALRSEAQVSVGAVAQQSVGLGGQAPQGVSVTPAIAANGRFLVFQSSAPNLVAGDVNGFSDILLKDLNSNSLSIVSLSSTGAHADANSAEPAVSQTTPSGLFGVAFTSSASNLSALSNASHTQNIFLRFPTLGITEPVSLATQAVAGNTEPLGNGDSSAPSVVLLSAPERALVAYASSATNLVSAAGNGASKKNVFVGVVTVPTSSAQLPTSLVTTRLVTAGVNGAVADGDSSQARISADGRFIVFISAASNLLPGRSVGGSQVYLFEISTGATSLLSHSTEGDAGSRASTSPVLNYDGRFVVYETFADNIVPGVANGSSALVVYDRTTGKSSRVNSAADGTIGNGSAHDPSISANGRFVTFSDSSTNLVDGGTNSPHDTDDVFIKDLYTGAVALASKGANEDSSSTAVAGKSYNSLNGVLSFDSDATNLTSAATNGGGDIFLAGLTFSAPALVKGTTLDAPADVTIRNKQATIAMQKFSSAATVQRSLTNDDTVEISPRSKPGIVYDVRIKGTGGRRQDQYNQISARNTASVRNLKPGNYTAQYRAMKEQGGKTVAKTPFSPRRDVYD